MGQALHISSGLVSQIGNNTLNFNTMDRATSGTLSIGGANTTVGNLCTGADMTTLNIGTGMGLGDAINIGGALSTTTIQGDLEVDGTETVHGASIFEGDVDLGDLNTDTISFVGVVDTDITYSHASRSLLIANGATQANLTIKAANNSAGAGGDLFLTPGTGSLATNGGSLVFGPAAVADATAYQIFANTNEAAEAGLRYNNDGAANKWQIRVDNGSWLDVATGANLQPGTNTNDILQWNGTEWEDRSDLTLYNGGNRTIGIATGDNQRSLTIYAQDASSADTGAGVTTIRGGNATGTGTGAALNLTGGSSATGTPGAVNITGGQATGAGTGANVVIRAGAGGTANGNVILGDTNTLEVRLGAAATNYIRVNPTGSPSSTPILEAVGNATINLPGGAATNNFQIQGTPVSDNVTATNLNTLTAGAGSDASALHTHAGLSSSDVSVAVTTDGSSATFLVYITAADAIASARADAVGTSKVMGVKTAANKVMMLGVTTVQMEGVLSAAVGDDLWLSATQAGAATNVAPSTSSQFLVYIGQAKTSGNTPQVYLRPERPIAL